MLMWHQQSKRRRTSSQLRQRAAAKAQRMSLPTLWVSSKTRDSTMLAGDSDKTQTKHNTAD